MKGFGQPQLAMILPLDGQKLVNADIEKVKLALTEQGYYLELPPPPEDLLKQHLSVMGRKQTTLTNNRYPAVALSLSARVFISTIGEGTLCINITTGKVRCWIIR